MACSLTAAACFRRWIVSRGPDLGLKATKDGWYSMPCPAGHHGKPLRLQVGTECHIFYPRDTAGASKSRRSRLMRYST